jgi:hypothetical protein
MPVILLRPDNFEDRDGKFSRIVQADTGPELLQKVKEVYQLEQIPQDVTVRVYSGNSGITRRFRLDLLESLPGTDPLSGWVSIHRAPAPVATDPAVSQSLP